MQEVRLDLPTYDELKNIVRTRNARINALEKELQNIKDDHEEEIDKMVKEGKVRCIRTIGPFDMFFNGKESIREYKGFDDVKAEVEEHFKQGLFNEELEKYKQEHLNNLIKQLVEKEETIQDLKYKIERIENRSLIERICNK